MDRARSERAVRRIINRAFDAVYEHVVDPAWRYKRTAALACGESTGWRSSRGCEGLSIARRQIATRSPIDDDGSIGEPVTLRDRSLNFRSVSAEIEHLARLSNSKQASHSPLGWTICSCSQVLALIAVVSFGSGIVAERYVIRGPWPGTDGLGGSLKPDGDPETDAAFPRQAEVRKILEDEYFFLPASPEARATFEADLEQGAIGWPWPRRRRWLHLTTTGGSSTTARHEA